MCNIKTLSGNSLRSDYTAFEINVFNYINNNNIEEGTTFEQTSIPGYATKAPIEIVVLSNNDTTIKFRRMDTKKVLECLKKGAPAPAPAPTPTPTPTPTSAPDKGADSKADKIAAFMAEQKKQQEKFLELLAQEDKKEPTPVAVDENIINDVVNKLVNQKLAEIEKAATVKVQINKAAPVEVGDTLHPLFKDVLLAVKGGKTPYLYGPAGTGKSTLASQVAKALDVPFYCVSSLQQKYELEGFVNATGEYQETELYKCVTQGGVFLLDEIDNTAAEVLIAFNNLLANGYYTFPKYGRIVKSDKCYFICAGNTRGRGGDESYNGRFQLDASTLDRFTFMECNYDPIIELKIAQNNADLVDFIHEVRKAIQNQGLTYTASPRAIDRVVYYEANGLSLDKCLMYGLCGGWDPQDIKTIAANLECNNKYVKTFKTL